MQSYSFFSLLPNLNTTFSTGFGILLRTTFYQISFFTFIIRNHLVFLQHYFFNRNRKSKPKKAKNRWEQENGLVEYLGL